MNTLMIPVSQLTPPRMRVTLGSNGLVSLHFHPICAVTVTRCSSVSIISEKLSCSSRLSSAHQSTDLVTGCIPGTTRFSLHLPPPKNPTPNSTKLERGGRKGGTRDVRRSLSSSSSFSFSFSYGASAPTLCVSATRTARAASRDDSSSQAEEEQKASPRQNSTVLSSVSETTSSTQSVGSSGEDGEADGRVQKTTTVLQAGGQETESLVVTEEEYKLTDEGTLSTVKVTRGGTTHRTNTKVARVLADVGMQVESLQKKIQNFSVRNFFRDWGKKEPGLEDLKFNPAMYDPKEGVSNIAQWTATELTLQRAQLVRISRDSMYLVWAFSFFGGVRIMEAVVAVFATNPPNFMKLMQGMNAMDPLTVASLAHGFRKPLMGLLEVDPTNLEDVNSLRSKLWAELHKFFERQWKVIATLGVARAFTLFVTRHPSAEWFTSKLKVLWDISMALPIF